MGKSKALGDTEKTVLVGALIVAGWLGLDAFIQRVEKRSIAKTTGEAEPRSIAAQRARIARGRRRRRRTA